MRSLFDPGYYTEDDLQHAGFGSIGKNVLIAKNCTIIGEANIRMGDNVRIDGLTTIIATGSGWLNIGSFVHVAGYCLLSAGGGIELADFSGLSQGVKLYTRTDDYSGETLTNPTVPAKFTGVLSGSIKVGRHVIIGSGSVVLPGVTIGDGSSVGALSLVRKSLPSWEMWAGSPARKIRDRSKQLLELERQLLTQ